MNGHSRSRTAVRSIDSQDPSLDLREVAMKSAGRFTQLIACCIIVLTVLSMAAGCSRQKGKKNYVIAYINPNPEEREGAPGFLRNMPKYGYFEGQNVTYIKLEINDRAKIESFLRSMVAQKVDLILAMSTPVARLAKKLTAGTGIPVVILLYDAVQADVVDSLTTPGGNITGVQFNGSSPKALEWLRMIAPGTKRLFVPVCFDTGAAKLSLDELKHSARMLGLSVTVSEVRTVDELRSSLASMPRDVDAIFMIHSWLVGNNTKIVVAESVKRKIPILSAGHVHADDGLLLSYGPTDETAGQQAARLAHHILSGTPPKNLPVETSEYYLGVNLRTAGEAGIRIPDTVLEQANYIVR
jgi:putative ABC transport system substrate-binding protein